MKEFQSKDLNPHFLPAAGRRNPNSKIKKGGEMNGNNT
jgi:hypothetical protein